MLKIKLCVYVNDDWAMKGYDESRYSGTECLTKEVNFLTLPREGETIFLQTNDGIQLYVSDVCHMIGLDGSDSFIEVSAKHATPEEMKILFAFGFMEE